jgi:hypothetical protein
LKDRSGFVSNSSSSSFIVKFKGEEELLYLESEECSEECEQCKFDSKMVAKLKDTLNKIKIRAVKLNDQKLINLISEFTVLGEDDDF